MQSTPQAENISNTSTDSSKPAISADSNGNVFVAWEEGGINTKKEIYLGTSSNSGLSFSVKKDITKYIGYNGSPMNALLKANGEIGVVWAENKGTQREIFFIAILKKPFSRILLRISPIHLLTRWNPS